MEFVLIPLQKISFLKAEWRKLTLANYEIDITILQKHLG